MRHLKAWMLLCFVALASALCVSSALAVTGTLPDGRLVTPVGFTIPVEGFASSAALSPDGRLLAVLSQDGGAIDVIVLGEDSRQVDRLATPFATGMAWTQDGLYVTRGYSGAISRFNYSLNSPNSWSFSRRPDLQVGGLLNGIAEDPDTHRIAVARTANQEVDVLDDESGSLAAKLQATGQPFAVGFAGNSVVATIYNSDHVDVWQSLSVKPALVRTGPHPTALLIDRGEALVANADGHDVAAVDPGADNRAPHVSRRYDLGTSTNPPPGQTPSGMALSNDGSQLYVAESGFNDVAVVDVKSARVMTRIPTGWYPMAVAYLSSSTIDKDPRVRSQLFVVSGQGLGAQQDPASEWNGMNTGLVQHVLVDPYLFGSWSSTVTHNNRLAVQKRATANTFPPIKHFVFIVKENKHFDEVFGDVPGVNGDPTLVLYGRKYTPNAHALAETYTIFDNFMGDGEKSDFGHSWTTQGFANDYLERNGHTPDDAATDTDQRVAYSIWPRPLTGESAAPIAALNFDWFASLSSLPHQPRINISGVFGPRGELIDELRAKGVSFRVYGEQMTMLPNGAIGQGLAAHAARPYPGAHIDFDILDDERARIFLADVTAHGLASYSYITLPTNHTAGTRPGFYTPASYVASNDAALGKIIAGLSKRPEWKSTVVFVTEDDPQGTGDHVDSRRMPAFMVGPYVRRGHVDSTRYSIPAVLKTVEVLFGLGPLNIYDAAASPMLDAFTSTALVLTYRALPSNISMTKNPGTAKTAAFLLDGPDAVAIIPSQEWSSIKGERSLAEHRAYLRALGINSELALDADDP